MAGRSEPLPMRPQGFWGRVFGRLMEAINAPSYRLAFRLIDAQAGASILEIGFGTGKLLELLARKVKKARLAGVEPTETMLETALKRGALRRLKDRLDLRLGTADALPWDSGSFDAVAALHCFQFWADPQSAANEILRTLKPGGRFVLILRDHSKRAPKWLPNPISKSGNEFGNACRLLQEAGFESVRSAGGAGSSLAIVATKAA